MQPGDTLRYGNNTGTVLPDELYKRLATAEIASRRDFLVGLLCIDTYSASARWVIENHTDDHYVMTAGEINWNPLP